MSNIISSLIVELSANTAKFITGMEKANQSLTGIKSALSVIKFDAIINIGERAYQMGQQLYESGRAMASFGMEIEKQAKTAGMSTDAFQKWTYAAHMSDVSSEDLAVGMKRLAQNMSEAAQGQGKANEGFTAMGIKVTDTSGKLKPFDQMLMEIAGKFSQWEDGPNKIAIALALFGRQGEALIPILNKGKVGIQEFFGEAQNMNAVLGKETVRALAEAEDAYKRFEITWKISKAEFWAPMVDIFGQILDRLRQMKAAFKEGGFGGLAADITRAAEEANVNRLGAADWTKEWAAAYQPPAKKAAPTMAVVKPSDTTKEIMDRYEAMVKAASDFGEIVVARQELMELGWKKEIKDLEALRDAFAKDAAAAMELDEAAHKYQKTEWEMIGITKDEYELILKNIEANKDWKKEFVEGTLRVDEFANLMKDIGQELGTTLTNSMTELMSTTDNWGEKFKKVGESILQSIAQIIAKTMLMQALFGNAKGEYTSGQGLVGILGGALKGIFGGGGGSGGGGGGGGLGSEAFVPYFQHGGYVNRPTLAMIGEGGEGEFVIPESKMGGRGDTYITYVKVDATDVESFEKKYGSSVLAINESSARRRGAMHKIMRTY